MDIQDTAFIKQVTVEKPKLRDDFVSLLRPPQIVEIKEQISSIENMLADPIARKKINIIDNTSQLNSLKAALEDQSPHPFKVDEMDRATALELELRAKIVSDGMPTHKEMRQNPAGAVDKHMKFEKRNRTDIRDWKNLRLRMGASGHDFGDGLDGNAHNLANLEKYRPTDKAGELPMDKRQIVGKEFYGGGKSVVFNETELALIKAEWPDVYARLALLEPEQRELLREEVANIFVSDEPVEPAASKEPEEFVWATSGTYAGPSHQSFFKLKKAIFKATGVNPKNKVEAQALIIKHKLV